MSTTPKQQLRVHLTELFHRPTTGAGDTRLTSIGRRMGENLGAHKRPPGWYTGGDVVKTEGITAR